MEKIVPVPAPQQPALAPVFTVSLLGNVRLASAAVRMAVRGQSASTAISFDHPDPSIYTVLTSPSATPGTANVDFVIFPPRWMVGENTFRPPWFHRNVMSEFMGLIRGAYDAKAVGFVPGGSSLHNSWTPHGPDAETFERASSVELKPHKLEDTMAFMFETRYLIQPTRFAMQAAELQHDYSQCWQGLKKHYTGKP